MTNRSIGSYRQDLKSDGWAPFIIFEKYGLLINYIKTPYGR